MTVFERVVDDPGDLECLEGRRAIVGRAGLDSVQPFVGLRMPADYYHRQCQAFLPDEVEQQGISLSIVGAESQRGVGTDRRLHAFGGELERSQVNGAALEGKGAG